MLSEVDLHSLIQLIYEAAVEPDKWSAFLQKWALAVGAQSAALAAHDLKGRMPVLRRTSDSIRNVFALIKVTTPRSIPGWVEVSTSSCREE